MQSNSQARYICRIMLQVFRIIILYGQKYKLHYHNLFLCVRVGLLENKRNFPDRFLTVLSIVVPTSLALLVRFDVKTAHHEVVFEALYQGLFIRRGFPWPDRQMSGVGNALMVGVEIVRFRRKLFPTGVYNNFSYFVNSCVLHTYTNDFLSQLVIIWELSLVCFSD